MHTSDWLVPLSAVVVALLSLAGVVFAATRNKEPRMSEVWTENSNLRDRLDKQDEKIAGQDKKIESLDEAFRVVGRGFDVLFRLFGRDRVHDLTGDDRQAVDDARKLRGTGTGPVAVVDSEG